MTTMKWIRTAFVTAALAVPAATVQGAPVCGTWELVQAADTSDGDASLVAVAAVDGANAWAIGTFRKDALANPVPLVMRWNGAEWSKELIASSSVLGREVALEGIAIDAEGEPVVAGHYRDLQTGFVSPLVLRKSRGFWTTAVPMGARLRSAQLRDVAIVKSGLLAVGETASPGGAASPFAVYDDGNGWREVPVELAGAGRLAAVAATPGLAWAVGHDIASVQFAAEITVATIYQWTGRSWVPVEHPAARPGTVLNDVVAIAPDDVWAVGHDGANALFLHWDGVKWTEQTSPASFAPTSVDAAASDDVWAVSANEHYHFDGATWTTYPAGTTTMPSERRAIAVAAACELWTVGSYVDGQRTVPLLERMRDANAPEPPAAPAGLTAVASAPSQARIEWTAGIGDPIGFILERCLGDSAACGDSPRLSQFQIVAKLGANATVYVDSAVKPATYYTYRVRAFNDAGPSPYSDIATVRTLDDAAEQLPVPTPTQTDPPVPEAVPQPESDPAPSPAPQPSSETTTLPAPEPSSETTTLPAPEPSSETTTLPAPQPSSETTTLPAPQPSSETAPLPTPTSVLSRPARVAQGETGPVSRPQGTPPIFVPPPPPPADPACAAAAADIVTVDGKLRAEGELLLKVVLRDAVGGTVDAAGCVPLRWVLKEGPGRILETNQITNLQVTLQGSPGAYLVEATAANGVSAIATVTLD